MLDADLADLYDVEEKVLVQAMERNVKRFLDDFMFQLPNIPSTHTYGDVIVTA